MGSFLSFVSLATKYLGDPVVGGDTRKKGGAGAENDYRGGWGSEGSSNGRGRSRRKGLGICLAHSYLENINRFVFFAKGKGVELTPHLLLHLITEPAPFYFYHRTIGGGRGE